jgi:hypothetical protein
MKIPMPWSRRRFLQTVGVAATAASCAQGEQDPATPAPGTPSTPTGVTRLPAGTVHVARNGDPVAIVQAVLDLAGGVAQLIGKDDFVVLKPNGQWSRQGYTHTLCIKALIDLILSRPGGFTGEIIIAEHVHRSPADIASGLYCWNMPAGSARNNNWPDMNYMELVDSYHQSGFGQVNACPLYDVSSDSAHWAAVSGPAQLADLAGKHGWVRLPTYRTTNGSSLTPSYAILRSPYSGKLVDLSRTGGVWHNGAYTGQSVRLIFLPTLNNHGSNSEDYAGITSAVKTHIGFQEGTSLHNVGYSSTASLNRPDAVGEAVGHLLTTVFDPTFYLTCAVYTGHESRTGGATLTRTAGLCRDPVTLDYWMCKNVLYPCRPVRYFDPTQDNNTRRTLVACNGKGVGTLDESQMVVKQRDL